MCSVFELKTAVVTYVEGFRMPKIGCFIASCFISVVCMGSNANAQTLQETVRFLVFPVDYQSVKEEAGKLTITLINRGMNQVDDFKVTIKDGCHFVLERNVHGPGGSSDKIVRRVVSSYDMSRASDLGTLTKDHGLEIDVGKDMINHETYDLNAAGTALEPGPVLSDNEFLPIVYDMSKTVDSRTFSPTLHLLPQIEEKYLKAYSYYRANFCKGSAF